MTRTLTRAEVAKALGVSPRTVTTWVAEGCPRTRDGERDLFDAVEVRRWREGRAASPAAPPATSVAGGAAGPAGDGLDVGLPPRDSLVRAELVRKLTIARKNELELAAEKGLKDLDLGARIRAAKSHDDMLTISSEVCALVGTGALSPARGRTIQGLLAEMRHSLKQHRDTEVDEEAERFVLLTDDGLQLVEAFESIVSDERRALVLAHVRAARAQDESEQPDLDLAAEPGSDAGGGDARAPGADLPAQPEAP